MANRTATLIRNAKLPVVGWRRGLLVTSKNGRVKPDYMMRNGLEVHCPEGHYDVRYYVGRKIQHKNVGADLETAQSALKQFTKKLTATNMLTDLGVSLPGYEKTSTRKTLAIQKATFLDKYARGSTDTIALYTVVANEFVKVLEGKSFAEQIEESDVIRYDRNMEARGLAKTTRSNRYTTLRCFLRHCGLDPDKVVEAPTHKKLRSKPEIRPEMYTQEELDKLIAASSPYHALAWQCYYKFGFRDEELAYLEKSNIDFERKVAMVRFKPKGSFDWNPELAWKPKDSEERDVPIPNSLITMLRSWFDAHPHTRFVVGTANDRPNIKFLKALKSDWRRAGLNCGKCSGCLGKRNECQDAYLHKFRSTYLTRMLSHTNSRNVQKLAGHSSIVTTERYLCPAATDQLQDAVNAAFE